MLYFFLKFPENAHIGIPESVNALLGVAHQKEVGRRRILRKRLVQQVNNFGLHPVGILKLIHQQPAVLVLQIPAYRGSFPEQLAGKRQQIGKIHQLAAPLFGLGVPK